MDLNSGPSFVRTSGSRVWIATIAGTGAASASSSRRSFVTASACTTICGTGIDTGACGAAALGGAPGAGGAFCGASAGGTVPAAGEAGAPKAAGAIASTPSSAHTTTMSCNRLIACSGTPAGRAPYRT